MQAKTESPEMTHEMTLTIMRILDDVRGRMGLKYPQD